jgi:hypothetical protein
MSSAAVTHAEPFPHELQPALDRALARAAVLGNFDPLQLVGEITKRQDRKLLLGAIGADSREVPEIEGSLWRLDPDKRQQLLRTLASRNQLKEVAAAARPLATDAIGRFLIAAIGGEPIARDRLSTAELSDLHTALQLAEGVVPDAPGTQDVETALAQRDFDDAIDFLLPAEFIGREKPLRQLRKFVAAHAVDQNEPVRTAVLSGIGGAGKSALLAKFVDQERKERGGGMPVIWLDFDRATLASADDRDLLLEFSRQLARCRPELSKPMAEFRQNMHGLRKSDEETRFETDASASSHAWSMWRGALGTRFPVKEPVLLILDTFEEILLRDELELERVLLWIAALHSEGGIPLLKPVLSGRGIPEDLPLPSHFAPPLRVLVEDLDTSAAARLLEIQLLQAGGGVDDGQLIHQLAARFGGNPLVVRILARYCQEHGAEAARELLKEDGNAAFAGELAQAFLYTRILKRIRTDDPAVTVLAHPGLALRRITPHLIQKVLAEPCALRDIDPGRAEKLFDKLAEQVWLVEWVPGQRAVRHRRDLRRLMLQAMAATKSAEMQRIHEAARDYFQVHSDPWLTEQEQYVEALYHFYMAGGRERLRERQARELLTALGSDAEDLPVAARAELKLYARRSLAADEATSLDPDLRERYDLERLQKRVERGSFSSRDYAPSYNLAGGAAREFPTPMPPDRENSPDDRPSALAPYLEANLAGGDFDTVRSALEPAFDEFRRQVTRGVRPRNLPADLTHMPIWRVSMVSLADAKMCKRLGDLLHTLGDPSWSAPMTRSRRSVSAAAAVSALFGLIGRAAPAWVPNPGALRRGRISQMDELRLLQLARGAALPRISELTINADLLCYFMPAALDEGAMLPEEGWLGRLRRAFEANRAQRPITLADIRRFSAGAQYVELTYRRDRSLPRLIRGMTPELYPAVRAVVAQPAAIEFTRWVERTHPLWPVELREKALNDALERDPHRWLATLIECADRFGELDRLIDFANEVGLPGRAQDQLRSIWKAYDGRLRECSQRIGA